MPEKGVPRVTDFLFVRSGLRKRNVGTPAAPSTNFERWDRNSESRTRGVVPGLAPGAPSPGGAMPQDRSGAGFSAGSGSNMVASGLSSAHGAPYGTSCKISLGRAGSQRVTNALDALLIRGSQVRLLPGAPPSSSFRVVPSPFWCAVAHGRTPDHTQVGDRTETVDAVVRMSTWTTGERREGAPPWPCRKWTVSTSVNEGAFSNGWNANSPKSSAVRSRSACGDACGQGKRRVATTDSQRGEDACGHGELLMLLDLIGEMF